MRRLLATPLAAWERDGLKAALVKAGLPSDRVSDPQLLFWRFETYEDVPVGFGGLEILGSDAVIHSVVTLPPLRQIGMGSAIVEMLESEARAQLSRALSRDCIAGRFFRTARVYIVCAKCGTQDHQEEPTICCVRSPRRSGDGQADALACRAREKQRRLDARALGTCA